MNFLNIGTMELMVIIAIAILVIGPQRMVQVARTIGRMATRMRQISGEFTSILRSEFAELDDARQEVQGAIGEIAGGRGKASAAAEVTGAVGGAKAEADQSMESLLEDGLGLGQIAAELFAGLGNRLAAVQPHELFVPTLVVVATVAVVATGLHAVATLGEARHTRSGQGAELVGGAVGVGRAGQVGLTNREEADTDRAIGTVVVAADDGAVATR